MSYSPRSDERSNIIHSQNYGSRPSTRTSPNAFTPGPPTSGATREVLPRSAPALPSLATLTNEVGSNREQGRLGSPTPWRSLGVRNILNPTSETQVNHAQPIPPSPQASAASGQHVSRAAPDASPHIRKRGEPNSPAFDSQVQQGGRTGRRILTPRSPALRAASMGTHRSPSMGAGLITRVPLPSGDGRGYVVEPGEGRDAAIPPLPPLSASARGTFSGLQPRDPASSASHPVSAGDSMQRQDNKLETSRPPYPSGEPNSSGYPPSQNQMHQSAASAVSENPTNYMTPTPGPVRSGLPYGQTEYQLTFETQQGPMVVPVNVDYQQASRLADEKRKRNAGASARFRARRKEKEREANATIAGLQQELQEILDEREFYLRERNFFRDLLARNNPGPLPTRPHSPQARRSHSVNPAPSESASSVDYGCQEMEAPVTQRQRAGEYQPSLISHSPSTPYNPPFPPPGPAMTLPAPPMANPYSDPRLGPHGPPLPPTSHPPPPFDPLRRNVLDRDWNTSR